MNRLNYIGRKYGRLTVLSYDQTKNQRHKKVIAKCDCGKIVSVYIDNLVGGKTKSCGCLFHEKLVQRNTKHGFPKDRLYIIWKTMRQRCNNANKDHFDRYGGRGITYCKEWEEYPAFRSWALQNGYHPDLSLDRIDNDGMYCPDNCRWVTQKKQMNNTSKSVFLEVDGITHTIAEWSEITGVKYDVIYRRYKKGLGDKYAVFG